MYSNGIFLPSSPSSLLVELLFQLEVCAHSFFDELREPHARLPNGRPFPPLFNFKQEVSDFRAILFFILFLNISFF